MKPVPTVFLQNQERRRPFHEYLDYLWIRAPQFMQHHYGDISPTGSDVLLVGGGIGCNYFASAVYDIFNFTNIDLDATAIKESDRIKNISADFITFDGFDADAFSEIWALYSLPMYATSAAATKLFYLKSMLYLKPGGLLRVNGIICNMHNSHLASNLPDCETIQSAANDAIETIKSYGVKSERTERYGSGIFKKPNQQRFNTCVARDIESLMTNRDDFSLIVQTRSNMILQYNERG